MKFKPTSISSIFVVVSVFLTAMIVYLVNKGIGMKPQSLVSVCGDVLRDFFNHIHVNPGGVLSSVFFVVVSTGATMALWQVFRYFHTRYKYLRVPGVKYLPNKLRWVIRKHHINQDKLSVIHNHKLTAYTIGILTPKIVISDTLVQKLSQEELEAVVLHEMYHLKKKHTIWLLFSRLVSSFVFYVPAIAFLARQLHTEFELAADAFAVNTQQTGRHLRASLAFNLQNTVGVAPNFASSPIEKRVESLIDNSYSYEKIGTIQLVISLVSIGLLLMLVLGQPHPISANPDVSDPVCAGGTGCETVDCTPHYHVTNNFTPAFFSSSY